MTRDRGRSTAFESVHKTLRTALGALFLVSLAGQANAQPAPADGATAGPVEVVPEDDAAAAIRVLQQRPIKKDSRFELVLGAGIALNDQMYDHWLLNGTGRFHISEWVSVAATYNHYFASENQLWHDVIENFELFPERSEAQWYAGADMSIIVFDGKFAVFNDGIGYFDIYASIGGGVTKTSRSDSLHPTGMIGVGSRLFLAKWLALNFEVRDYIFVEDYLAGTEIINNVVGQMGFSIFIPFGFDYTYPR